MIEDLPRALQATPSVDRREALGHAEFFKEYVKPRRPVILSKVQCWKEKWPADLGEFANLCGDVSMRELRGGGGRDSIVVGGPKARGKLRQIDTLGQYLRQLASGDAELPYLTNLSAEDSLGGFYAAFEASEYFFPNWLSSWPFNLLFQASMSRGEVFIGPAGNSYGITHFDRYETYVTSHQIVGKKLWWLASADQGRFMYPASPRSDGYAHHSPVDPFAPDRRAYPLFDRVDAQIAVLEPGDVFLCPPGYWHNTCGLTPHASIAVRVLNRSNIRACLGDFLTTLPSALRSIARDGLPGAVRGARSPSMQPAHDIPSAEAAGTDTAQPESTSLHHREMETGEPTRGLPADAARTVDLR